MAFDPNELSLGAVAAERETLEALSGYFVALPSFVRLESGLKSIVLGRRGAGKTAIFRVIGENARNRGTTVLELTPADYSYELLSQTLTSEDKGSWAKQGAYAAAWKFLLYVLGMKAWVRSHKGLKTRSEKRIYTYLRDHHHGMDMDPIDSLISYLKRLEGVKLGKMEASLKAQKLHNLYKLEEIEPFLDDLNNVCAYRPLLILVDELDAGWDATEDAKAFVAGLFRAATTIPIRTPNVRVYLSLRLELFDNIPELYEDAQKYRDIVETIEWDETQLLELIANRLGRSFRALEQLKPEERWNSVFGHYGANNVRGSFQYVLDRTLHRPRELLQFCIDLRNVAIERGMEFPPATTIYDEVEKKYSDGRIHDITSEYRFQYPGLLSIFETFRGASNIISREDLELHCTKIAVGEQKISQEAIWCLEMEPDDLIEVLYQVGFLRAEVPAVMGCVQESSRNFIGTTYSRPNVLLSAERFQIHHMFQAALAISSQADHSDLGLH